VKRGAALVTGAARRIGRTVALELARAGFDVAVHYRGSEDEAVALVREIEALGRKAAAVRAELADAGEVRALAPRAAKALGPLSLLVNNASIFLEDQFDDFTDESFTTQLEVNLRAPLMLAQAFARQAPEGSSIVNIVDQRVLKPTPEFFSYSVSKAGLWFATKTMAQALAPRVRVNAVAPVHRRFRRCTSGLRTSRPRPPTFRCSAVPRPRMSRAPCSISLTPHRPPAR
jgi:NAD(P)-dependent dehydrogenase (short-subunit alcohol dehydrogenase family)